MLPSPSMQWFAPRSHTPGIQAQVGVSSHSGAMGSHVYFEPAKPRLCSTHVSSAGHDAHVGTTSQISAGTQLPQQPSTTRGTEPFWQVGGFASQATVTGLQDTSAISQWPNVHVADMSSRPSALHDDCSQSMSHVPGASSMWNAPHVQQSSTSTQSAAAVQAIDGVPVSPPESLDADADPLSADVSLEAVAAVRLLPSDVDGVESALPLSSSSVLLASPSPSPSPSPAEQAKNETQKIKPVDRACNVMTGSVTSVRCRRKSTDA
jgi:hypothetical protein